MHRLIVIAPLLVIYFKRSTTLNADFGLFSLPTRSPTQLETLSPLSYVTWVHLSITVLEYSGALSSNSVFNAAKDHPLTLFVWVTFSSTWWMTSSQTEHRMPKLETMFRHVRQTTAVHPIIFNHHIGGLYSPNERRLPNLPMASQSVRFPRLAKHKAPQHVPLCMSCLPSGLLPITHPPYSRWPHPSPGEWCKISLTYFLLKPFMVLPNMLFVLASFSTA